MKAKKVSFDDCFQTLPDIRPPEDLDTFWQSAIQQMRKIALEPQQKLQIKRSLGREIIHEIQFLSAGEEVIHGRLSSPRLRRRTPIIVTFHDYGDEPEERTIADSQTAHLAIRLRNRNSFASEARGSEAAKEGESLQGPIAEFGLAEPERSYMALCYLDALRTLDYLKLRNEIDQNRIMLLGRGLGASMALFAAAQRPEAVEAIALERPALSWMPHYLPDATSRLAREIRQTLDAAGRNKAKQKKGLEYFDLLNWVGQLDCRLFCGCGLEDHEAPPRPIFALFNHFPRQEKIMDLYITAENEIDPKAQREKAFAFLLGSESSIGG